MEILSIVLYFVSGIIVASVVMVLLGIKDEINGLKQQVETFKLQTEVNNSLYKEIEEIHRRVGKENDDIHRSIHEQNSEIYRYIDSRHDKLENKLIDIVKNGCEPAKSK